LRQTRHQRLAGVLQRGLGSDHFDVVGDAVRETASTAKTIATDIAGVNVTAEDLSSASAKMSGSAMELKELASQLQGMTKRFKATGKSG